ncbi:hypothetical protein [uncultured Nostoc sp.]|uniref:hypothetical protein n=1 Tax=uncultured Nostoc sp. TaxID=340711 RepID=UPI0035CAADF9
MSSCNQSKPTSNNLPVQGIVATLEDKVEELPNKRIAWSTYWKMCWDKYPQAIAYELQTITSEGRAPKFRRQSDRCFQIQAAAGENNKAQGLLNRDAILSFEAAQLSYRVRAVLERENYSKWSPAWAVGEPTSNKIQQKSNRSPI